MKAIIFIVLLASSVVSGCGKKEAPRHPDAPAGTGLVISVLNQLPYHPSRGVHPTINHFSVCSGSASNHDPRSAHCEDLETPIQNGQERSYFLTTDQTRRLQERNGEIHFWLGDTAQAFISARWNCWESIPRLESPDSVGLQSYRVDVRRSHLPAYGCDIEKH